MSTATDYVHMVHPAAERYPLMSKTEVEELAESILAHGQQEPIWLDTYGFLIDGRNRLTACRLVGVDPRFETYLGDDIEAFVELKNEHRKHYTTEQRIALRQQRVKELRAEGKSTTAIADEVGVSSVQVLTDLEGGTDQPPKAVKGKDGKNYPPQRRHWTDEEAAKFLADYANARTPEQKQLMSSQWGIANLSNMAWVLRKRKVAAPVAHNSPAAAAERRARMVELAAAGHNSSSIAKELGVSEDTVRTNAAKHGIEISADKIVRGTRRIRGDRVVDAIVQRVSYDYENDSAFAAVDLSTLDRNRLSEWVSSLDASIDSLKKIRKQLAKELTRG